MTLLLSWCFCITRNKQHRRDLIRIELRITADPRPKPKPKATERTLKKVVGAEYGERVSPTRKLNIALSPTAAITSLLRNQYTISKDNKD